MSIDPFLNLRRPSRALAVAKSNTVQGHAERAHSKFSASGAERWFNCPGSVELSEGQPDKSSPWAQEGTEAHEVLEALMRIDLSGNDGAVIEENSETIRKAPRAMFEHGASAAKFIIGLHERLPDSEILVETRIYLDFIHPEMFGTFDGAVVDHFGTLHVFDYKYGQGHAVSPGPKRGGETGNLQMIFYGIGLAHQFKWNFKRVRLWIIQPRIKGYEGPLYWDISIQELKGYVDRFREAVERVERHPRRYVEGSWCHWCKAKAVCPLKQEGKLENAFKVFSRANILKTILDD